MRPISLVSAEVLAANKPHGERVKYMAGCRCMLCRAANSRYETDRLLARKNGDWNGLVPAQKARRHLLRLSKLGIGRRAVAAATDISQTILSRIKNGERRQIRKRTQDRILAVTTDAASDSAVVPAATTWRQLEELIEEGFSKAELARRLGYSSPALQLRRDRVLARTAARVDRLYRTIMKEADA